MDAHRAVPDYSPAWLECLLLVLEGLRANVQDPHMIRELFKGHCHCRDHPAICWELTAADKVPWHQHLHSDGLSFLIDVLGPLNGVVLHRCASRWKFPGLQERRDHGPTEDNLVHLAEQRRDLGQLLGRTVAPQNQSRRPLVCVVRAANKCTMEAVELPLHEETNRTGLEKLRHCVGGAVSAVCGAKVIVDVEVCKTSHTLCELRIVLQLALLQQDVLQQDHVAFVHGAHERDDLGRPSEVWSARHGPVQQLPEPRGHALQRGALLGSVKLKRHGGAHDDHAAFVGEVIDRGDSRHDPPVIHDLHVPVGGDVQVAPN
mmetsp:Transcript_39571/g.114197  ORF Transcript_39571/g.114197 Transcript_39571/m.114197 type:complete len:317 (-) Transcript_39571:728-1678(-)